MKPLRLDDPELPLKDLMNEWPETIRVFIKHKMACIGCPVSPFHTVGDACDAYGLDRDWFYAELAKSLSEQRRTE